MHVCCALPVLLETKWQGGVRAVISSVGNPTTTHTQPFVSGKTRTPRVDAPEGLFGAGGGGFSPALPVRLINCDHDGTDV